jgi:hypothetical protein
MGYTFQPQPGEKVVVNISYRRKSKSEALHLIVSNQAIYIPAKNWIVDPYSLRRIPLDETSEVRIQMVRPYWAYATSLIMIGVGFTAFWSFTLPEAQMTPMALGRSIAMVIGGALMPIAARGRQRLIIRWQGGSFKWLPPLHVDSESKVQMNGILSQVVKACETVQVPTTDDRIAA